MDLTERKLKILQAIVGDFISSAEPVGSRSLSRKYDMGISPATIRNEMSDLEDMGYLTHPHTSAGRVPSDKAYRLYVNSMMQKHDLTEEQKLLIEDKLDSNLLELDKTMEHAAKLLSELTNLTSFALTPKQDENILKYVNLLPVDERTIVLMIVTESGRISNMALKVNAPYTEENLQLLSKVMTHNYKGKTINSILTQDIASAVRTDMDALNKIAESVVPNFISTLEGMLNVELFTDGLTNIFNLPEYNDMDKARNFIRMLDRKDDMRKYLVNRENGIMITIGEENDSEMLKDYSLVTATYSVDGKTIGRLGVIGPTRMKYDEVISVIEYMTDNLTYAFKLPEGEDDGNRK